MLVPTTTKQNKKTSYKLPHAKRSRSAKPAFDSTRVTVRKEMNPDITNGAILIE